MQLAITPPDQARCPVAARHSLVVAHGGRSASHVSRFQSLRVLQQAVAKLHGPVIVGRKREPEGARAPWIELEIIAILVRLAAVEERAFEFEPAIGKARRKDAERDMRRIL